MYKMSLCLLRTTDDKYVVVRDAHIMFLPVSEIMESDSFRFKCDWVYSSIEISVIHQVRQGCLSLSGTEISFQFEEESREPICYTSNKQGNQLVTTNEQPINFPLFHFVEYDYHMDKNFQMTEFEDSKPICLYYTDESSQDYDPKRYLMINSRGNQCCSQISADDNYHVCYQSAGKMSIYDIKYFIFDRSNGSLKIRPFTDPEVRDEYLGETPRGVHQEYLCVGDPCSPTKIVHGMLEEYEIEQTQMILGTNDLSNGGQSSLGIRQISINKVILYDTKTNKDLTPILTKDTECRYLCEPTKDTVFTSQNDNFEPINYTEEQIAKFKKIYDEWGVSLKSSHGHLVISDGQVMLKEKVGPNDTAKFLLGKRTCTALSIMAIHNGRLGSIVGTNELKFVNNVDVFGNIFLGCTAYGNDDKKYGRHIIFAVHYGIKSDSGTTKYITYNNQLTITRGRPERFYVTPDKWGYIVGGTL